MQHLQRMNRHEVTIAQLSQDLKAPEADVRAALLAIGQPLGISDLALRLGPEVFDLEVSGTANTQVGHMNTQLNVSGPLHFYTEGERQVISIDALREALKDSSTWYDLLEAQLVRQRSRTTLTQILAVTSEQPEYEALFHQWLSDTPDIQGQLWFVRPALEHFSKDLTTETARRRLNLLRDLMDGLLESPAADKTLKLYKTFLTQLEGVPHWGQEHWNVLNAVTELFWLTPGMREVRSYRSESLRRELQEWATIYLTQLADRLLRQGDASTINSFLMGLGHLVQDIRTDDMIHVVERATRHKVLSSVLDQYSGRQLLNGLDYARRPSSWEEAWTDEDRRLRHSQVDDVANQILVYLEHQMGRSSYFYELVTRAGMEEDDQGNLVSRYLLKNK